MINAYTSNCVEGHHGTGSTGWVGAPDCKTSSYQVWKWSGVIQQGRVTTIKGVGSGRCLDSNSAGAVYMLDCNGGVYQAWRVYVPANGGLPIILNFKTNHCLMEYPVGTIRTAACDFNQPLQRWRFV